MKRTMLLLLVLLFSGCTVPARDGVRPPDMPVPETTDYVAPPAAEEADAPEELPEPSEPSLPTASAEDRFPDRFSETPEYGEKSYKSGSVAVTITTHTVSDTYGKIVSYHVADIYVKDVASIRTAAAGSDFHSHRERTVRDIADGVGALLAIDGDTFTHMQSGLVVRNGEIYRDTLCEGTDVCILYRDGRMETKRWGSFTAQEILDADPWQVWSFGPALLDENGRSAEVESNLNGHNPRAAIGYFEPGHYCFVIVDGRQDGWSDGVRLSALSRLMEDLGCKAAYNLDGGNSAQMYWNGEIVSKACGSGRVVSDIIYLLPEE